MRIEHDPHNLRLFIDLTKLLLKVILYQRYEWQICGYVQDVAMVLGMYQGYKKYCYGGQTSA